MNNEPLACPYCNALVPLDAGAVVGQRVPCPRCGEAFTLRQPPLAESDGVQVLPAATASPAIDSQRRGWEPANPVWRLFSLVFHVLEPRLEAGLRGRTNRQVVTVILGVMGLMAAVGLVYALYTQPTRRATTPPCRRRRDGRRWPTCRRRRPWRRPPPPWRRSAGCRPTAP